MTAKPSKPSRAVTRKECVVCGAKFTAKRKDARYCSSKCRQSALRARCGEDALGELGRRIDETQALYWKLVQEYAEARGIRPSTVLSERSPTVTPDGEVWIQGKHVGWTTPPRPGWTGWGLEAAPPPFLQPVREADETYGRSAIDNAAKRMKGLALPTRKAGDHPDFHGRGGHLIAALPMVAP